MKRYSVCAIIIMMFFLNVSSMNKFDRDVILKNGARENGMKVTSVYFDLIVLARHENVAFNELVEAVKDSTASITPTSRTILEQYRLMPGHDMTGRVLENIILSLSIECNADICTRLFLNGKEDFIIE